MKGKRKLSQMRKRKKFRTLDLQLGNGEKVRLYDGDIKNGRASGKLDDRNAAMRRQAFFAGSDLRILGIIRS